jgi:DNA-binding PadR family transcriptional regulator
LSVRSALLAILTIGPAYGFQLHGELASRTAGRRNVNVGQIYGTLERLVKQDAVTSAGTTPDGLPLYQLTPSGRTEAMQWLHDTASSPGDEWNDLVDRVLIASSLPDIDVMSIVENYREHWGAVGHDQVAAGTGQDRLAANAGFALATAALVWLQDVEAQLSAEDDVLTREFNAIKPRRGRRPAVVTT